MREGLNGVLGAGPVGRALTELLVADGRDVRVVTRSGTASMNSDVAVVSADVSDADACAKACAGAETVFG